MRVCSWCSWGAAARPAPPHLCGGLPFWVFLCSQLLVRSRARVSHGCRLGVQGAQRMAWAPRGGGIISHPRVRSGK